MRFSTRIAYATSREMAFLAIYASLKLFSLRSCLFAGLFLAGFLAIFASTVFIVLLIRVLYTSRKLVSLCDKKQTVLGKPLFFPSTITHSRLSPVKNQFTYRLLLIGVPVGLRCRVGNLLTIDQEHQRSEPNDEKQRPLFELASWFSFDSERYLHRGDSHLYLQEKLQRFLKDQNEDPNQWPFAYMISVPKFLWWSRSVVTWWYLYSPARELDAVIMEINNSFDEKRNVLFHVRPVDSGEDINAEISSMLKEEYLDTNANVKSLSSVSQSKFYKGSWDKHIFASPFEKVEGSISARFMDPLNEKYWDACASLSNTTSISPSGKPKMGARIIVSGPPLDPMRGTTADLVKFIWKWTLPGTLTTPRILFQAMRLHYYLGWMRMFDKPVIQTGSEPREATKTERMLEHFFRSYLASCIATYRDPLHVSYIPAKSISRDAVQMQSPSYRPGIAHDSLPFLNIEVVDPEFYTIVVNYADATEAFSAEDQCTCAADSASKRVLVSDFALLNELIANIPQHTKENRGLHASSPANWCLLYAAQCLRGYPSSPSFMDTFVFQMPKDQIAQFIYASTVMHHWMVTRLSFGSYRLLQAYMLLCATLVRCLVLLTYTSEDGISYRGDFSIPVSIIGATLYCVALVTLPF